MQKEYLSHLLDLYSKGELSKEQAEDLDNWFHSLDYAHTNIDAIIKEAGSKSNLINQLYQDFENYHHQKRANVFSLRNISIAASVLIAISFGIYFYAINKTPIIAKKELAKIQPQIIKPGGNKAILTLSNGKQIDLDDQVKGELIQQKGIKITKTKDGQLLYQTVASNSAEDIGTNTIYTPRGGQYQVILEDGTHVWLNAASTLKYPTKFTGNKREVELSGEAYFEVAHNANAPFRVKTKDQTLTVLGTHFNVNSYDDEDFVKTTLLQGSVKVVSVKNNQSKMLTPGQQSVLENNQLNVKLADVKNVIAWKNGYFRFNDEDIHVIMNQIARWYDVDIAYNGNFNDMRFGGYISRDKSINEILNLMQVTKSIRFNIEGRKVIVMK
ncbi:FecR family protein [Pedobacter sp. SD-b]|uniref:FecR family protein n=1 Tax=Pedobacter segetis TaxID=2793069 RepID=A0ABS1BGU8_9SPHI|nr:FecR family protein [Pedobacter segetis]MBK0382093.1 FecR family protein [Pedobacter segetis]